MADLKVFRILLLVIWCASTSQAQEFGGTPASLRWRQINTDTTRIIFPKGLDSVAGEITSLIRRIPSKSPISLGEQVKKINIVLQNQTIFSNGYVGMGPYRSEFQLTPLQNSFRLGSLPWHMKLALHEYRHVEQYNNFNRGIVRPVYKILGQEAGALLNNVAIPDWFWEGDAVFQETFYSKQGRGRLPFFFNDHRSLAAAKKKYSWMKLRNGSLRDLVPDHYRTGFMLVAYGREKYGQAFWRSVTQDASAFTGFLYPFQTAVKRHSGQRFRIFASAALDHFLDSVSTDIDDPVANAEQYRHFFANYEFPQWQDDSTIVFVKSSFKQIPVFATRNVNTGKETILRVKDISPDNHFSFRNGKIVYAAYNPDLRWGWRDFSDIRLLDARTNIQRSITHRGKYFSPDISPDGHRIVAVHVDSAGSGKLHILNVTEDESIRALVNKHNYFYTYPKFYDRHHVVSAVRDTAGRMAVIKTNIETGVEEQLTMFSYNVIGFLSTSNDTILFTAGIQGTDQIFTLVNGKLMRYRSPRTTNITGNYQPSMLHDKLAWNVYTSAGFLLQYGDTSSGTWEQIDERAFARTSAPYNLSSIEQHGEDLLSARTEPDYVTSKYPRSFRLLNFHSLRPDVNDPTYSIAIVGENVLNTFRPEVSLTYNRNEQFKRVGFYGVYSALFPWFRAGVDYTIDRNALSRGRRIYWNELQPQIGVSVPLNLTGGRFSRFLTVSSDYVYNKTFFQGNYKDSFDRRAFSYIHPQIQWSSQMQKAQQQIYPSFAQTLLLSYRKAITRFENNQFLASSFFYLPGITRTNSLVLTAAFHQRDSSGVIFTNNFPFSRGYSAENFRRMYRLGANYHLPLFYPDAGFANIVYFLRVRGNMFFDYTKVFSNNLTESRIFKSAGMEVFFDTKWWNQQPVSFGVRYSRLLDDDLYRIKPNQFELILPVNLLGR